MKGDREILPCYAYRDSRTGPAIPEVHRRMPYGELYCRTGIQHQPFNTIYQLYADQAAGRLAEADSFLPIPSYLMYRLCGIKAHEFTEATTGGMVNAVTGEYDPEIIDALGFPRSLFPKLQKPGTVIGNYLGMKVVLCATHDTASAAVGSSKTMTFASWEMALAISHICCFATVRLLMVSFGSISIFSWAKSFRASSFMDLSLMNRPCFGYRPMKMFWATVR